MTSTNFRSRDNGEGQHFGLFTYPSSPTSVSIHTYGTGQPRSHAHIMDLPIQEFLDAVRTIPGVTVDYNPVKKYWPVVGTILKHNSGSIYIRVAEDEWISPGVGNPFTDDQMFYQAHPTKHFTEVYP